MPLAEDNNVIQTVAPKRSDEPFSVGILPRRARRGGTVTYPHPPYPTPEKQQPDGHSAGLAAFGNGHDDIRGQIGKPQKPGLSLNKDAPVPRSAQIHGSILGVRSWGDSSICPSLIYDKDIDLLAQHQILGFKRSSRSKKTDECPPDQSAKVPHGRQHRSIRSAR
jgi:hypothetical protein